MNSAHVDLPYSKKMSRKLLRIFFYFTRQIVQRQRISQFDAEVDHLKKIMCRMQERLGLTNLEDDGDYGNEVITYTYMCIYVC